MDQGHVGLIFLEGVAGGSMDEMIQPGLLDPSAKMTELTLQLQTVSRRAGMEDLGDLSLIASNSKNFREMLFDAAASTSDRP